MLFNIGPQHLPSRKQCIINQTGVTFCITESGFEMCFGWDRWDRWDPAPKAPGAKHISDSDAGLF